MTQAPPFLCWSTSPPGGARPEPGAALLRLYTESTARAGDQVGSATDQREWLQACQLQPPHPGAGAFCMTPGRSRCVPYFANLTLTAVAADPALQPCIRPYLDWYVRHMDRGGYIDDYLFTDAGERPGRRDSEDSYAATFLTLVRAYTAAQGPEWATAHLDDLRRLEQVIRRAQSSDGLCWAKRSWPVKFTEDNCEVYRGLCDWAAVLQQLDQQEAANSVLAAAWRVRAAVLERLYDPRRQCFYYARLPLGLHVGPNWRRWIEVATQLFPLLYGVLPPSDLLARVLYERLTLAFPRWFAGETGDPFPWLMIGQAAALLADGETVERLLRFAEERHISTGSGHWYCAEAGYYLYLRRWLAADGTSKAGLQS